MILKVILTILSNHHEALPDKTCTSGPLELR